MIESLSESILRLRKELEKVEKKYAMSLVYGAKESSEPPVGLSEPTPNDDAPSDVYCAAKALAHSYPSVLIAVEKDDCDFEVSWYGSESAALGLAVKASMILAEG